MITSRSILLRVRNFSNKSCRDNQDTLLMTNKFPPPENRVFRVIRWKKMWSRTGHIWQHDKSHVHWMLYNWGYKHTLETCNTYCFSMATKFARSRLDVPLRVDCLPRWVLDLVLHLAKLRFQGLIGLAFTCSVRAIHTALKLRADLHHVLISMSPGPYRRDPQHDCSLAFTWIHSSGEVHKQF